MNNLSFLYNASTSNKSIGLWTLLLLLLFCISCSSSSTTPPAKEENSIQSENANDDGLSLTELEADFENDATTASDASASPETSIETVNDEAVEETAPAPSTEQIAPLSIDNPPAAEITIKEEEASTEVVPTNKYGKYFNVSEHSLLFAAKRGSIETLKYLLGLGIDVNFQNAKGETALMAAARNGRLENVIFLLENGANTNLKNKSGKTAIQLIGKKNSSQIKNILKDHASP
ncbi:MAG: hypothetical protein A2504_17695 [Bdellovibrionales bacterium RIFOXYD12_FULL_39_22]|nr:MAG: hypothetical protein A2385_15395 [Bdellovibrionales bacterium RIFOXYB1_FULL_39_21]OFZ40607.1 MAG: hypothetical protein A2485_03370 [Bdellovibrionales bacterium RIFOXYC12_FULL_39_17]OFZ50445.1 MAG: hypothetical protein A2404_02695 [Bdellovibrionales bacterium RIFOXYC1_FULL_39_130]OFZ77704.1 MAG: hypothetical protein A2560_05065 [Bdellovibrionales bacterium RIFOXYD1_FULL_39_84]OFZ91738.1 MAG: hypothetical protein A2504_17695 [Bdellovibrionales bacterium RIFOXYD12_FULL_39_22]HLE13002.1 an